MLTKEVPISTIRIGDTVLNRKGLETTVCGNDINYDSFMGYTLFGDSYKLGKELITKITY